MQNYIEKMRTGLSRAGQRTRLPHPELQLRIFDFQGRKEQLEITSQDWELLSRAID